MKRLKGTAHVAHVEIMLTRGIKQFPSPSKKTQMPEIIKIVLSAVLHKSTHGCKTL